MPNENLRQLVADVLELPLEQVNDDAGADTIEAWDSLKHLDIVLAVEIQTGVKFKTDDIPRLTSLKKLEATVEELKAGE